MEEEEQEEAVIYRYPVMDHLHPRLTLCLKMKTVICKLIILRIINPLLQMFNLLLSNQIPIPMMHDPEMTSNLMMHDPEIAYDQMMHDPETISSQK